MRAHTHTHTHTHTKHPPGRSPHLHKLWLHCAVGDGEIFRGENDYRPWRAVGTSPPPPPPLHLPITFSDGCQFPTSIRHQLSLSFSCSLFLSLSLSLLIPLSLSPSLSSPVWSRSSSSPGPNTYEDAAAYIQA